MKLKRRFAPLAVGFVVGLGVLPFASAEPVGLTLQTLTWSEPRNLSNSEASSADPTIVADPYGNIHVFWSEDLGGDPHPFDRAPRAGNAILYRRLDAQGNWTEPIDIVYVGPNGRAENPSAVVDSTGVIHLVWIEHGALAYSFAHAVEASDPKSWSVPSILTGPRVADSRIVDLDEGVLVVFTVSKEALPGVHAIQVVDGVSGDMELIWLAPEEEGHAAQFLSVAQDGSGRIHIVWEVNTPPNPSVEEVRYARSLDDGHSWSGSRVVARTTSQDDQVRFARPWIASRNGDEIHIEWAQGRLTYRWHQFSTDGGDNWEEPYQIWPDFVSSTGSQAVGVDAANNLLWVDVLRYPNGAYSMRWEEGAWTVPELLYLMQEGSRDPLGDRINAHRFRTAISLGNQIHIVFQDQDRAEVYYMTSYLDIPGIPPVPVPVFSHVEVIETPSFAETRTTETANTPAPKLRPLEISPGPGNGFSTWDPILIGIGSSILLVSLAVLGSRLKG